jgi:hypothetical protein
MPPISFGLVSASFFNYGRPKADLNLLVDYIMDHKKKRSNNE